MSSSKVTIWLMNSEILEARSEREAKLLVWQKGIDAGIPWEASIATGEVRACRGTLTIWEDFEHDRLVVEWDPAEMPPPKPPKVGWIARLMEHFRGKSQ